MTWRFKVQGVVITILVLGALAVAAGAQWIDSSDFGWLGW